MNNDFSLTSQQLADLKNGVKEMSDSKLRQDAEKTLQKEIVEALHEKTGIEKKLIRKIALVFHKGNSKEVANESESVTFFVDALTK